MKVNTIPSTSPPSQHGQNACYEYHTTADRHCLAQLPYSKGATKGEGGGAEGEEGKPGGQGEGKQAAASSLEPTVIVEAQLVVIAPRRLHTHVIVNLLSPKQSHRYSVHQGVAEGRAGRRYLLVLRTLLSAGLSAVLTVRLTTHLTCGLAGWRWSGL